LASSYSSAVKSVDSRLISSKFPLMLSIKSPRQQDIDSDNYHNMLNILISNTPDDVQLIIAAVQNYLTMWD
jgi:hypothetical protein